MQGRLPIASCDERAHLRDERAGSHSVRVRIRAFPAPERASALRGTNWGAIPLDGERIFRKLMGVSSNTDSATRTIPPDHASLWRRPCPPIVGAAPLLLLSHFVDCHSR